MQALKQLQEVEAIQKGVAQMEAGGGTFLHDARR
jgi:hypothetical protein